MIIGHNDIIDKLNKLINNNEVAHSYIFNGKEGIGKLLVALDFARNILCGDNQKERLSFDNHNHPDFNLIKPDEKGAIKIETIREMIKDISIKPILAKYKVYIIDNADSITPQAQNALLKTLEEPPNYAVIILVTSKYNSLLNTIRSRSQKLDFTKLKNSDIINYMKDNNYQTNLDQKLILSLIDGSIGNISQVFDNIDAINKLVSFIDNIQNVNAIELNDMAIYLGEQKDNIYMLLDYLETIMYERIKNADISRYIKSIEEAKKNIQGNVNFEICIDKMLLAFEEEQYV